MEKSEHNVIGTRIQNRRQHLNMSIRALADHAGVDDGTIRRLEHGHPVNTTTLYAIAGVLGLSLSDLFATNTTASDASHLPAFTPYLRTKYPQLSSRAVSELSDFFDYLQYRYGQHRPSQGHDER